MSHHASNTGAYKAAVHQGQTGILHQRRKLEHAHGFIGYRLGEQKEGAGFVSEAQQLPASDADNLDQALADFTPGLAHKNTLIIHGVDGARNRQALHFYRVVQKRVDWRRNERTGLTERYHPLAAKWLFTLPVNSFDPARPFDAFVDTASGVDGTLIEGTGS